MRNVSYLLAAVGAGWVLAAQEGPPPAYDTTEIPLPKDYRSWPMVRAFIIGNKRSPAYGIRNAFFDPAAQEEPKKNGTAYPDGATIAMSIHGIVDAPNGHQTQGTLRGTLLMVRDSKKHSATDGWGDARFNAKGESVKINPLKNCHECHRGAEKTGWVFTQPAD